MHYKPEIMGSHKEGRQTIVLDLYAVHWAAWTHASLIWSQSMSHASQGKFKKFEELNKYNELCSLQSGKYEVVWLVTMRW